MSGDDPDYPRPDAVAVGVLVILWGLKLMYDELCDDE